MWSTAAKLHGPLPDLESVHRLTPLTAAPAQAHRRFGREIASRVEGTPAVADRVAPDGLGEETVDDLPETAAGV
jgi:hypothetical protein